MTMKLLMEENLRSCVICFFTLILSFIIQKQRKEKNYIILFKNRITLKKDVDVNYALLEIQFEEEVISLVKVVLKKQLTKIRNNVFHFDISYFFGAKNPLKKDVQQKQFLQDVDFLVVKSHLPIQFARSTWLKCVTMHFSSRIVFPFKTLFSQEVLLDLVKENKQEYVLPS